MKKNVILLLIFTVLCGFAQESEKVDVIIFSYNRPLQLYALLESMDIYVQGIGTVSVIYRSDSDRYESAYDQVKKTFSAVSYIKQGQYPAQDFKPLLLNTFKITPSEYVMFAVDDIVVCDFVDLTECVLALKEIKAYGFYLRLGRNISYCYAMNKKQHVSDLLLVRDGIYLWRFEKGSYDWAYPNTVDMTIYKKSDILNDLEKINYRAPNSLEGAWHGLSKFIKSRKGLCFERSKMVNLPLNIVQKELKNRHAGTASTEELLDIFERNMKMDIKPLFRVGNVSPHMSYIPTFIDS